MGVRSDVGVALKNSLFEQLTDDQKKSWFGDATEILYHMDGALYVWRDVKWYVEEYKEIEEMYAWLKKKSLEDFLIVVACHDYPGSDEDDCGGWHDNPWGLSRSVSVSLNY